MNWKKAVKKIIPNNFRNSVLLAMPLFYSTKLVDYETVLRVGGGIDDLILQLNRVLGVKGDIIECGSARCGTSIIMARFLLQNKCEKSIYAYDSFEGFDPDELADEHKKGFTKVAETTFKDVTYDYVKNKIKKLGFEHRIKPVKGYFKETLPFLESKLSLALIDCDLEESMAYCAESLWSKLNSGGCVVFDDYASGIYLGAKKAVDVFLLKHNSEISEHGMMKRLYYVIKK